jgi:hypothetical protein
MRNLGMRDMYGCDKKLVLDMQVRLEKVQHFYIAYDYDLSIGRRKAIYR